MKMLVKFEYLELDTAQLRNREVYPHEGCFLVYDNRNYYIIGVVSENVMVYTKVDKGDIVMNNDSTSSGISEGTLLKIIEMLLNHQQQPQPQPITCPTITTPSSPFPPYEVICKEGISGTNARID